MGMTNTEELLNSRFWFPGYSGIVRAEIEWCDICKKILISKRKEPVGATIIPNGPFQIISMDFKGPMDDGYYTFVLLCTWTKWPEVYWVKSTSFNSIKKHLDSFWAQWGRASIIISDLGPPFFGHEFKDYLKTLGIKHRPTLPENPQNNEVENVNRRIRKAVDLAKVTKED